MQVAGVDLISSLKWFTICVFLALKAYIGFVKCLVLSKIVQIRSTLIKFPGICCCNEIFCYGTHSVRILGKAECLSPFNFLKMD